MHVLTLTLVVLGMVSIIALVSIFTQPADAQRASRAIHGLVEQTGQLLASSKQDGNPLFAVIHATASVANAEAVASLTSDENMRRNFGASTHELVNAARQQQKAALKNLGAQFPDVLPADLSVEWITGITG